MGKSYEGLDFAVSRAPANLDANPTRIYLDLVLSDRFFYKRKKLMEKKAKNSYCSVYVSSIGYFLDDLQLPRLL